MTLFDTIKTIIFLTIFLAFAPVLIERITKQYSFLFEPQTLIAIIPIPQHFNDSSSILQYIHDCFKTPSIKGIIITINSAETAPGTSQSLFHDIRHLKKQYPKPIIALIENSCLEGTYLIASACDYIIACESSLIGNIGHDFIEPLLNTINDHKNDSFISIKNEVYNQLIKHVALSRKLSLTTTNNWAEGKIFTGSQAIALGLINEIGSLCAVIKILKERALIEGEIQWIQKPFTIEKNISPLAFLNSFFMQT